MNFNIYEDCVDVVEYLDEVNKRAKHKFFNIRKYIVFEDYPYLYRFHLEIRYWIYERWYINKCNLIIFNEMIQDIIMNDNDIPDEDKDDICLTLQLMKDNYDKIFKVI